MRTANALRAVLLALMTAALLLAVAPTALATLEARPFTRLGTMDRSAPLRLRAPLSRGGVRVAGLSDDDVPGVETTAPVTLSGSLDPIADTDDVYRIAVPSGTRLIVELTGDPGTDFDLYIFGRSTESVNDTDAPVMDDSDGAATSDELATVTSGYDGPGFYYIDVYAPAIGGAIAGNYELKITADPDGDIPGGFEFSTSASRTLYGSLSGLYDFDDVGRTDVIPGQVIKYYLDTQLDPVGALRIWGPDATTVDGNRGLLKTVIIGSDEYHTGYYWVREAGPHYLDLTLPVDSYPGGYEAMMWVLPVDLDFDVPGTRVSLPFQSGPRPMWWNQNIADVYCFHATAGSAIRIDLSGTPAAFDMQLFGPGSTSTLGSDGRLAVAEDQFSNDRISINAPATGDYYVRVVGRSPNGNQYNLGIQAGKTPTSATIRTSATSVNRPKPFVLQGTFGGGTAGDLVIVWVKKPGKSYFSYSSNRLCFGTAPGGTNWWYRYTPLSKTCPAGTYYFKTSYPGSATKAACVSPVVTVRIR